MNILEISEAWGIPPWQVGECLTHPEHARWYHRQVAWTSAQNKRAQIEAKRRKHG